MSVFTLEGKEIKWHVESAIKWKTKDQTTETLLEPSSMLETKVLVTYQWPWTARNISKDKTDKTQIRVNMPPVKTMPSIWSSVDKPEVLSASQPLLAIVPT